MERVQAARLLARRRRMKLFHRVVIEGMTLKEAGRLSGLGPTRVDQLVWESARRDQGLTPEEWADMHKLHVMRRFFKGRHGR